MKDMSEVSCVIGIEILCGWSHGLLGLSHKTYINKVLKSFARDKGSYAYLFEMWSYWSFKVIAYSYFACFADTRSQYFVLCIFWLECRYHGRVQSSHSLLNPLWRLNLWHALRPQFRPIGYETLFQDLDLLKVLVSCWKYIVIILQ